MARFKDERSRQQAVQKYGEAQLAFHMSRSQFALQLVNGRADIAVKMTARAGLKGLAADGAPPDATGEMAAATVDPAAVFALADALAREDMRLRIGETKLLGDALGQASEIFEMPRIGEPFKVEGFAPKLVITGKDGG